jgi:hypothetical protein
MENKEVKVKILAYYPEIGACKWCEGKIGTIVGEYTKPERGTLVRFDGYPQCPHKGGMDPTQCFFEAKHSVLEVVD